MKVKYEKGKIGEISGEIDHFTPFSDLSSTFLFHVHEYLNHITLSSRLKNLVVIFDISPVHSLAC